MENLLKSHFFYFYNKWKKGDKPEQVEAALFEGLLKAGGSGILVLEITIIISLWLFELMTGIQMIDTSKQTMAKGLAIPVLYGVIVGYYYISGKFDKVVEEYESLEKQEYEKRMNQFKKVARLFFIWIVICLSVISVIKFTEAPTETPVSQEVVEELQ